MAFTEPNAVVCFIQCILLLKINFSRKSYNVVKEKCPRATNKNQVKTLILSFIRELEYCRGPIQGGDKFIDLFSKLAAQDMVAGKIHPSDRKTEFG